LSSEGLWGFTKISSVPVDTAKIRKESHPSSNFRFNAALISDESSDGGGTTKWNWADLLLLPFQTEEPYDGALDFKWETEEPYDGALDFKWKTEEPYDGALDFKWSS
jgi:hypothetical protein